VIRPAERPTPRVVVVGCGAVAEGVYRGALTKLESRRIAHVVALVDPNPARTAALQRHFPNAAAFVHPAEAFARTKADLTIVTSPPAFHVEHALAAIAASSHVLCEKPMAVKVEDADRMVAEARLACRILAVGMTRRMYPSLRAARALVSNGTLGHQLRFTYREGHVFDWPVSTDAVFRRTTAGGGVLTDVGSHALDLLGALFGVPTVVRYADDAERDGVETNCHIELEYPDADGTMQLSWAEPLVTGLTVTGSAGELRLDPTRLDALWWRQHEGAWTRLRSAATLPSDLEPQGARGTPRTHRDCFYYQLVQVLRAVTNDDESVPVTGDEGLSVVRTINACYRQATALRIPWVPAAEQASAGARHWSQQQWVAG